MMKYGIVEALLGGFYYISVDGVRIECRARGNFRNRDIKPVVGDRVGIRLDESTNKGYIVEVLPRKNQLVRPPVSNVDVACIVCSLAEPQIKMDLIEKFLFTMQQQEINTYIILTKTDLISAEALQLIKQQFSYFEKYGIQTFYTSQENAEDAHQILQQVPDDAVVLLTGQTGVGKTTFLNNLGFAEQTQEISKALGRGKHTTRAATFYTYESKYVIDTPGFSSFDLQIDDPEELAQLMYQFLENPTGCKFRGCLHDSEPGCMIKNAVENGEMPNWHYDEYIKLLKEVKQHVKY
ncbi:MAG: ribosome small subunit-dependent GTPase A [Culicoidibacterales bacterium]